MNFSALRDETWKQLVKGQKEGLVRNIGVSNYNIRQLKELLRNDHGVKPAINQVEWHPDYHQDELLKFCKKQGVALQAYFSLGGVNNKTVLLEKPEVKQIAIKLRKSPSQVLLKWALQQNVLVVPGSRTRKHMDQNLDLNFKIPEADMKILNNLKQAGRISMFPDIII
ncbi:unnamed protein product [Psylliodes chrysocephalus]|nr:unnamed protein product [Psylliodes chrysocephala]